MKYEKRKKNGTRYSLNTSICFNCSFLYCFRIITGIKHKSYSFITTSMLSISNLDYLAMHEQTAIVVYKFNVTIFKVFLYYMLNFAGENLHIFF